MDLRVPNWETIKDELPLLDIEAALTTLLGAEAFVKLDLSPCYREILLHEADSHIHAFRGPDGVYVPLLVLHGCKNGTQHISAEVTAMFQRIDLLYWLDTLLPFGKDTSSLFSTSRITFQKMSRQERTPFSSDV